MIATLMVVAYHSLCLYTNKWNYMDAPHITIYEQIAEILNRIDMPAFVFIINEPTNQIKGYFSPSHHPH